MEFFGCMPYHLEVRAALHRWEDLGLRKGTRAHVLVSEGLSLRPDLSKVSQDSLVAPDGYPATEEQAMFWEGERLRLIGLGVLRPRREGERLRCVSPGFFVPKSTPGVWRLVVDQRPLNACLPKPSVRYPRLIPFLNKHADWPFALVADIADAFYSVGVAKGSLDLMGVAVLGEQFVMEALPMGLSHSPGSLVTVYKVIGQALERRGFPNLIYLDDALVLLRHPSEAVGILNLLRSLGLRVKEEKVQIGAKVSYLGHVIDLGTKRLCIQPERREALIANLDAMAWEAQQGQRRLPLRRVQSLTGKLEYAAVSVPTLRLELPPLHACQRRGELVLRRGQAPLCVLNSACLGSLRRLRERLARPLHRTFASTEACSVVWTDASDAGYGVVMEREGREPEVVSGIFVHSWKLAHINIKELRALSLGLELLAARVKTEPWRRVVCYTDSSVVEAQIWRNYAPSPSAVGLLETISALAERKRWRLTLRWIPSEENLADQPSRDPHRDTFQFRPALFQQVRDQVRAEAGPVLFDLFASRENRLVNRFCSREKEIGSAGSAWRLDWGELCRRKKRVLWAKPPFVDIPLLLRKIQVERESVLLVAPEWHHAAIEELRPRRVWSFKSTTRLFLDKSLSQLLPPPTFRVKVFWIIGAGYGRSGLSAC